MSKWSLVKCFENYVVTCTVYVAGIFPSERRFKKLVHQSPTGSSLSHVDLVKMLTAKKLFDKFLIRKQI